jgi:hypothetical protein
MDGDLDATGFVFLLRRIRLDASLVEHPELRLGLSLAGATDAPMLEQPYLRSLRHR